MIWDVVGCVASFAVWLPSVLLGMALFFLYRRHKAVERRVEAHLASMGARLERLIALLEMGGGSREKRGAFVRRTSAGTYTMAEQATPTGKGWEAESMPFQGDMVREARAHLREGDDLLEVSRRLNVGLGETRLISKLMELGSAS